MESVQWTEPDGVLITNFYRNRVTILLLVKMATLSFNGSFGAFIWNLLPCSMIYNGIAFYLSRFHSSALHFFPPSPFSRSVTHKPFYWWRAAFLCDWFQLECFSISLFLSGTWIVQFNDHRKQVINWRTFQFECGYCHCTQTSTSIYHFTSSMVCTLCVDFFNANDN